MMPRASPDRGVTQENGRALPPQATDDGLRLSPRVERAIVGVVLCALAVVEIDAARRLSTTFDEPAHIGAGVSYLVHHDLFLNPEHPPLVKLMAGASLLAAGAKEGSAAAVWAAAHDNESLRDAAEWSYGDALLYHANDQFRVAGLRAGAESVLFAARLPIIVFPLLLALVAWGWARSRFGSAGGIVALLVAGTYPDVLGHGALVTNDVPIAALGLAAAFAMDRLQQVGGVPWLAMFTGSVALAIAVKFNASILVIALMALAVMGGIHPIDPAPASLVHPFGRGSRRTRAKAMGVVGLLAVGITYVTLWICYLGHDPISAYRHGIQAVNANHESNFLVLCLGRFVQSCWGYFPAVVALKAPLGTLGLGVLALVAAAVGCARGSWWDELLLHAPAIVLLGATIALADPLGSRYMIPVLAFLFVSTGRVGIWAARSPLRWGVIAMTLGANVIALARDHPFYSASTNLLAGAPRLIYTKLDDSNQDWGQGLEALGEWQRKNGVASVVVVSRIPDADPAQLTAFGVQGTLLDLDLNSIWNPVPGTVYAVSAHLVARAQAQTFVNKGTPDLGTRRPPSEIVGGGYLIFDLQHGK